MIESEDRLSLDAALARGIAGLGVDFDARQRAQLLGYVELLAKWNRTYNLTAIRDPQRMLTHHLLDALAVLPFLPLPAQARARVLDVGSGGGVPGIPIAIARPAWHVTLVDSSHKKTTFLTQATIELGLGNVDARASRVEAFASPARFDVVISRAFADLATFVHASIGQLADGGMLVAMKGALPDEELAELSAQVTVVGVHPVVVPGLDAARHVVLMRKAA